MLYGRQLHLRLLRQQPLSRTGRELRNRPAAPAGATGCSNCGANDQSVLPRQHLQPWFRVHRSGMRAVRHRGHSVLRRSDLHCRSLRRWSRRAMPCRLRQRADNPAARASRAATGHVRCETRLHDEHVSAVRRQRTGLLSGRHRRHGVHRASRLRRRSLHHLRSRPASAAAKRRWRWRRRLPRSAERLRESTCAGDPCGVIGQACCPATDGGGPGNVAACPFGSVCSGGKCAACGTSGAPCCAVGPGAAAMAARAAHLQQRNVRREHRRRLTALSFKTLDEFARIDGPKRQNWALGPRCPP